MKKSLQLLHGPVIRLCDEHGKYKDYTADEIMSLCKVVTYASIADHLLDGADEDFEDLFDLHWSVLDWIRADSIEGFGYDYDANGDGVLIWFQVPTDASYRAVWSPTPVDAVERLNKDRIAFDLSPLMNE